jgi:hypothetical protein
MVIRHEFWETRGVRFTVMTFKLNGEDFEYEIILDDKERKEGSFELFSELCKAKFGEKKCNGESVKTGKIELRSGIEDMRILIHTNENRTKSSKRSAIRAKKTGDAIRDVEPLDSIIKEKEYFLISKDAEQSGPIIRSRSAGNLTSKIKNNPGKII